MLQALSARAPSQVAVCMPEIVPVMTQALGNARQAVKDAAAAAMTGCMNTINNKDLEQFIPMLIDTMQNPSKVPDCVHKLAATTFVQVSRCFSEWQACGRGQYNAFLSALSESVSSIFVYYGSSVSCNRWQLDQHDLLQCCKTEPCNGGETMQCLCCLCSKKQQNHAVHGLSITSMQLLSHHAPPALV